MLYSYELTVLSHQTNGVRSWSVPTVRSWSAHINSHFYHTRLTVWDHYLISLSDHGELTWTHSFYHIRLTVWYHYLISLWDHGQLTWTQFYHTRLTVWDNYLISLWDHGELTWTHRFYHIWLTVWDHYLISLWDHGQLSWTHSFITLDSEYEIIMLPHCEIMLYWYELTVLSHQTNGMRSWSVLTVRSWSAHINSHFYHTRLTVWNHYLIPLWDHGQLMWTHSFITLDSQYEILIWSHCEIMVSSHKLTVFITYDSQYEIIIWSLCEIMVSSHELTVLSP